MKRLLPLLIAAVLLASCAEPTVLDPPFGNSVRHMIALQTTDPSLDAPGLDGQKAINTLEAYRQLNSLEPYIGSTGKMRDESEIFGGFSGGN